MLKTHSVRLTKQWNVPPAFWLLTIRHRGTSPVSCSDRPAQLSLSTDRSASPGMTSGSLIKAPHRRSCARGQIVGMHRRPGIPCLLMRRLRGPFCEPWKHSAPDRPHATGTAVVVQAQTRRRPWPRARANGWLPDGSSSAATRGSAISERHITPIDLTSRSVGSLLILNNWEQ